MVKYAEGTKLHVEFDVKVLKDGEQTGANHSWCHKVQDDDGFTHYLFFSSSAMKVTEIHEAKPGDIWALNGREYAVRPCSNGESEAFALDEKPTTTGLTRWSTLAGDELKALARDGNLLRRRDKN